MTGIGFRWSTCLPQAIHGRWHSTGQHNYSLRLYMSLIREMQNVQAEKDATMT